ncbi:MAG: bifunctional diaminohydroxyphosphoribosylaminopyrimidine deaminase/5-amino-6-(5-phosphoribosylamino)uracil reductase RibD [Fusobacteriota bacterium]
MDIDKKYMKRAIELAKKGVGKVNPNPLVGAVVVKDGKIIGEGYHKKFGGPHAEVFALEEAGDRAKGATIYVSLEPCSHYGKTPPCAEKIIEFGIKRCVISMLDPNPLVAGNGVKRMEEAGIEVKSGILEEESSRLNRVFLKYIKDKMPYVFIKSAITLDGKTATKTKDSKWITNEEARKEGHKLRNKFMGIMVGKGTALADDPRLTCRIDGGVDPYRIILDPRLDVKKDMNIIKSCNNRTIICINREVKETEKYKFFKEMGVKFLEFSEDIFDMKEVFRKIGKLGIDSVLVEGGSHVISNVIKEDLVDGGVIFVAPKILGDNSATSFVQGFNINHVADGKKLEVEDIKVYGNNVGFWFKGIK